MILVLMKFMSLFFSQDKGGVWMEDDLEAYKLDAILFMNVKNFSE